MFLENAVTPENKFWKYIVGSVIVICASFIGQIPFMIAIAFKSFSSGKSFPTDEKSLMSFLNPNLSLFLLMLSFAFAFLAIYLVIKYLHKQTFLSVTTSRSRMDWKRFFFSFSIWGIFTIASTVIMYYANPEGFEINFKPIPFAILAVIAIVLIPIQTSTEEYIFRGYLMQGFAVLAKNRWFPLVLTSVIFGTLHIANPEVQKLGYIVMIYYIGTGFFLGIITLMDEGMELALGFHAANNLIAALLITSDWSAFQTESILKDNSEPSAGLEVLIPVFVIFPLLFFLFSKKYKWTDWKEKLTGKINIVEVEPIQNIGNHDSNL
jgi:membrane protease YdiL (CAAX protease family)